MIRFGREFFKLSGSGNDFVFVDARAEPPGPLAKPEVVRAICSHGNGIGADGVVFLEPSRLAALRLTYINADGTRADLCGNATLCTARMALELGVVAGGGGSGSGGSGGSSAGGGSGGSGDFGIETDVGVLVARFVDGMPEIDLKPVAGLREDAGIALEEGEQRLGFAIAGVPHLVVLVTDLQAVDVVGRGRPLRRHPTLPAGANVNFVQPAGDGTFSYRTYERGVEAETLACGTGAVATAALLTSWGLAEGPVSLLSRSGRVLRVRFSGSGAGATPSLSGEARIVCQGRFGELELA